MALVVLLLLVGVARLMVTMHQQEERISILESQVEALLADTSRLQFPASFADHQQRFSSRTHYYNNRRTGNYGNRNSGDDHLQNYTRSEADTAMTNNAAATTEHSHKFTEPHLFDLNTIDSLTLIRIPGIASRTASHILHQRQRYGGFYDANQLREFLTWDAAKDYLDEWCTSWFTANADRVLRISINKTTISQLQRHPYITYEQAVEISQYRSRHKAIHQASELQMLSKFAPEEINRLLPYLSFD